MRLHWIDALRGMGIILVVFAHHSLPISLNTYVYSFHMPLFFFISGFLFDFEKYAGSAANFIRERFRSLIVPYFCFALLICLFYFLLDMAFQPGVTNIGFFKASTLYVIYSILYAGSMIKCDPPLWFLTCLFVTELLFYGFAKSCYEKPGKLVFWLTAVGILEYLYSVHVPFRLPWDADVALAAVVFYGVGNLFKKITKLGEKTGAVSGASFSLQLDSRLRKELFRVEKFFPRIFILLDLLYLGYLLEFPPTDHINMRSLQHGGFFSFYFLAFSGIFAFVYLSKKIGSSKILEYYGRNSLIVLALHYPTMVILTQLAVLSLGVRREYFESNIASALSLTVLNLLFLVPMIFVINNYFPFILGKRGSSTYFDNIRTRFRKLVN
ncbi:MAG: acyltransferase family protein [Methanosarcina sp.]